MIIIDGVTYNVPVKAISRRADFLDKFAERTEDGVLHRELIGVYFNYQIEFGRTSDVQEYANLWNKLTEAVEFHTVTVPDVAGTFTFTAYFSNVGDDVFKSYDNGASNFWNNLTVNFTAQAPAET